MPEAVRKVLCLRLSKRVFPAYRKASRAYLWPHTWNIPRDAASERAALLQDIQAHKDQFRRKCALDKTEGIMHDLIKAHSPTEGRERPMNHESYKSCLEWSFYFMKVVQRDQDR